MIAEMATALRVSDEPVSYSVALVGTTQYQPAIRMLRRGNSVRICHELGNPFDKLALVAISTGGKRIGYIARDNWLQNLFHEEGKSCNAFLSNIHDVGDGTLAVVLSVHIAPEPADEVYYKLLK